MCGYFEHKRGVQFEGRVGEQLRTITAIFPGSQWSCLFLRIVLQDAVSEVTQVRLRTFLASVEIVEGFCG